MLKLLLVLSGQKSEALAFMGNWSVEERLERDITRFWRNTKVEGNCIIWIGQLNSDGYGKFTTTVYPKKQSHHLAHRWIYRIVLGHIKDLVMHSCDNPSCVKLQHLEQGDILLNTADRVLKNRGKGQFLNGENHPRAKLIESQVIEIRRLAKEGRPHKEIASLFSLTREAVRDIVNYRRWRHIT